MTDHVATNLRRLMSGLGWTVDQVVEATGLDRRTVRSLLDGTNRCQSRTINRLAQGLGVSVDEFFVAPSQLTCASFDRLTNPRVRELAESHPRLFANWTDADFAELSSRFGTGGALTEEGTLEVVRRMNRNREIHDKLAVILESSQATTAQGIIDVLYRQVTENVGV